MFSAVVACFGWGRSFFAPFLDVASCSVLEFVVGVCSAIVAGSGVAARLDVGLLEGIEVPFVLGALSDIVSESSVCGRLSTGSVVVASAIVAFEVVG